MSHFKDKIHQIRFPSVRPFVRLSLSVVYVRGVYPMGGTNRDTSEKLEGGG